MLAGAGIGLAPTFVVGKDLAEGRLVSLMPDYRPVESELSVIYPPGKNPSAKVRSLIDFLAARFGPSRRGINGARLRAQKITVTRIRITIGSVDLRRMSIGHLARHCYPATHPRI
jgi:hypothetical protein